MKKPLTILLACCLALMGRAQDQRLALLIGIGQYPDGSGWPQIGSANDLIHLRQVLERWGFDSRDVRSLCDEQATRAGILAAFRQQLLPQVQPGATVYIHFSGHGQQVTDDNGDESDGWDEALVPYDSPAAYSPGQNEGQFLLRDDELYALLRSLRARIGPGGQLWVTIDACHSGTATRGIAHVRGTATKMAPAQDSVQPGSANEPGFESVEPGAALSHITAFFASSAHELNYETTDENGQPIGSLSWALFSVLRSPLAKPRYRELFDLVRRHMATRTPEQTPLAEGSLENYFLNRNNNNGPAFFPVLEWTDAQSLRTGGGLAFGIAEGAQVAFYDASQTDTAGVQPLARGEVLFSSLQQTLVQLDRPWRKDQALAAKMAVVKPGFGKYACAVNLSGLPYSYATGIRAALQHYPFVSFSDGAADVILRAGEAQAFEMLGADGAWLRSFDAGLSTEAFTAAACEAVLAYAKTDFFKRLDYDGDGLEAELVLEKAAPNGVWTACHRVAEMVIGDSFRIVVHNRSQRYCYFALLHIGPAGQLQRLAPAGDDEPTADTGRPIQPRQSLVLDDLYNVTQPPGKEFIKILMSTQPIPLDELLGFQLRVAAENEPVASELFRKVFYHGGKRGGNAAAESVYVGTFMLVSVAGRK